MRHNFLLWCKEITNPFSRKEQVEFLMWGKSFVYVRECGTFANCAGSFDLLSDIRSGAKRLGKICIFCLWKKKVYFSCSQNRTAKNPRKNEFFLVTYFTLLNKLCGILSLHASNHKRPRPVWTKIFFTDDSFSTLFCFPKTKQVSVPMVIFMSVLRVHSFSHVQ